MPHPTGPGMPRVLAALTALIASAGAAGCDPGGPTPVDAGSPIDVRPDVPPVRPDSGPPCLLTCGTASACCFVGGAPTCVVVGNDPEHCGSCGNDCVLSRRGDACALSTCTCGDIPIGCVGGARSTCCLGGTGSGRCADLTGDFDDCGDCNRRCDVVTADRCTGGDCACGEEGRVCDGAGEACCAPRFGGGAGTCAVLATSREHCGACDVACAADELCRDGACARIRDAGPRDAGSADAGTAGDAGAPDGGAPLDAPANDAGSSAADAGG